MVSRQHVRQGSSIREGNGQIAAACGSTRSRHFIGCAAGLLLGAVSSPVIAGQAAPHSVALGSPYLESHHTLPEFSEPSAWSQLKRVINTFENMSAPIDPDDFADLLDLNKVLFSKAKIVRSLGSSPDGNTSFLNTQYENIPDNSNKIIISLSITQEAHRHNGNTTVTEQVLFNAEPVKNADSCILFSSIEPELKNLKWDGHAPGFYRGLDGVNIPGYDVIYLGDENADRLYVTIYLSKIRSCLLCISGNISNIGAADHAK